MCSWQGEEHWEGRKKERERGLLGAEDGFCLTWSNVTHLPLPTRLSTAHFNAYWLPLSLSMATHTISPFPFWIAILAFILLQTPSKFSRYYYWCIPIEAVDFPLVFPLQKKENQAWAIENSPVPWGGSRMLSTLEPFLTPRGKED